jgi:hypothetical protein
VGTSESTERVEFVCVRAAHHRRAATTRCLCDVGGWHGYCPAGDIGDHEWLPITSDLVRLTQLGYRWRPRSDEPVERDDRQDDDTLALIRR